MRRVAATFLWFYSFWYLGSMVAALVGVPDLLGPVLGIAAGVVVGVDPRRLIWARTAARTAASAASSAAATNAAPNAA
jgi:hypothetical protein